MTHAGNGLRADGMACSHRGALKCCSNGNCFVKTANWQLACCHLSANRGTSGDWEMCLKVVLGTLRLPRELQTDYKST